MSAEQLSCFVVHWHVAVLASAVMLVFVGNPSVIVGGDPSMVELSVEPVYGVGGVVVALLFITTHSGGVLSMESGLDVSSYILRDEVDRALDCVYEEWDGGVVVWEL